MLTEQEWGSVMFHQWTFIRNQIKVGPREVVAFNTTGIILLSNGWEITTIFLITLLPVAKNLIVERMHAQHRYLICVPGFPFKIRCQIMAFIYQYWCWESGSFCWKMCDPWKKHSLSLNATVCNILQQNEISHAAFINMPNLLAFYEIWA